MSLYETTFNFGFQVKFQLDERNAEEDKTVHWQITALWGGKKVELRETQRAVTPFGGLVVFLEFLWHVGYREAVSKYLPFRLTSPNAIDPAATFTAFLLSVVAGARRFAHTSLLRADVALHAVLGISRFPVDDTIRNLFKRFGQGQCQRFFSGLWSWQLERLPECLAGYSLDLDSTVFERYGRHNRRADMENRIAELKHDLGADDFCLQEFFATEAAFRSILLLFNLLGEFQRASGFSTYRQPATLRAQVFLCGALLGRAGHRLVLHLSASWGSLKPRIPLLENVLAYGVPTSPKLNPAPAT